ncbi:hypothetical protein BWQ96_01564 [Gracilariopsis chorda]|uniref:Uncharacterized protein n=1 Tax=Gracilariopsis chorda TaxID=448386 RepID=A0A2V3J3L6_9FLOR|nr:hypothetical protein BWQ96_01564 [Gracilariopsis chorda]|eukprot:PXF48712.1 hypothetical protein BWQ96_01564 [Gracilariopsis chorda]
MCACESTDNKTSVSDEELAKEAAESLKVLLDTEQVQPNDISVALDALTRLRDKLEHNEQERERLESEIRRNRALIDKAKSHQERLDHEIIEAKLQSSELLAARDAVARDLARAKKALEADNEADDLSHVLSDEVTRNLVNGNVLDSENGKHNSLSGTENTIEADPVSDNRDITEEEDPEKLAKLIAEEMELLNKAEKELVRVLDDVNSIKKRREEIRQKMKIAQEEW